MKKTAGLALLILFFSPLTLAAGNQSGLITKLLVHYPGSGAGKFDIALDGPRAGTLPAGCDTIIEWTGDLTSQAAQAQYSMLLAARIAGKRVQIDGADSCMGGREIILNTRLLD